MSWKIVQEVWEYGPKDHAEFSVLLAIAYYTDDSGENAWVSKSQLAKMVRYTDRGVDRLVHQLEEKQFLKIT